jgi:hypothetical protein
MRVTQASRESRRSWTTSRSKPRCVPNRSPLFGKRNGTPRYGYGTCVRVGSGLGHQFSSAPMSRSVRASAKRRRNAAALHWMMMSVSASSHGSGAPRARAV